MHQNRIVEINTNNFEDVVLASREPVLVDFTAVWCPPCKVIAPHVAAVAQAHAGRLLVGTCDADTNPELAARYDVRGLPTLLLFDRGAVVGQLVGSVPRARIEALVERALTPAVAPST